jgi:hypothetical protein
MSTNTDIIAGFAGRPHGIPTLYRNRWYRSRLEARWSAMFDLLEWQHEYEPYDLPGWCPDFLLTAGRHENLVEIKPFTTLEQFRVVYANIDTALVRGGRQGTSVLLLGCTIVAPMVGTGAMLGWSSVDWLEPPPPPTEYSQATVDCYEGRWGLYRDFGLDERDRIIGPYYGRRTRDADREAVLALWNEAGNRVQWRGGR